MKQLKYIKLVSVVILFCLFLQGCNTASQDSHESEKVKIVITNSELTEDNQYINQFLAKHKNVEIEVVSNSDSQLEDMILAGNMPDIVRVNGAKDLAVYAENGYLLELDPYLEKSKLYDENAIYDIQNLYKYNGDKVGTGKVYGVIKDWSVDTSLFINIELFKKHNIPIPDDKKSLTYHELKEIAKKLTVIEDGSVVTTGFATSEVGIFNQIAFEIKQLGKTIWDENGSVKLDDPSVYKIIEYWVDFAKSYATTSPIHQLEDFTGLTEFLDDQVGIVMYGYWFGGLLRDRFSDTKNLSQKYKMLPSPVIEGGDNITTCVNATGFVVSKNTNHPDLVWELLEGYLLGEAAQDRAKLGWGIPINKNHTPLLPDATEFDKQLLNVSNSEVSKMQIIPFSNEYIHQNSIDTIVSEKFTSILTGNDTVEHAVKDMEREINRMIEYEKKQ